MKVLIDINHPAHVHLFKNLYWKLTHEGHEVVVVASKKDVAFKLLENYKIPYINIGTYGKGLLSKLLKLFVLDIKMFFILFKHRPDFVLGVSTIRGAHAGLFFPHTKVLAFTDTEHAKEQILLYKYFADKIVTPECFMDDLGKKQIRYKGYHELAYIHPSYFKPDESVLKEFGVSANEKFFILRFVSWDATHDIGQRGISNETKDKLISMLNEHGKVFITSEGDLPEHLKKYQIKVSPEKIHHLMYYSQMYIGEGATMASEAALMGVPSLYVNTLPLGYINELEKDYGLLKQSTNDSEILSSVREWAGSTNIKKSWEAKKTKLLSEKVDVTSWIYNLLCTQNIK